MSAHICLKEIFELFRIFSDVDLDTNFNPDDFFTLDEYEEKQPPLLRKYLL